MGNMSANTLKDRFNGITIKMFQSSLMRKIARSGMYIFVLELFNFEER